MRHFTARQTSLLLTIDKDVHKDQDMQGFRPPHAIAAVLLLKGLPGCTRSDCCCQRSV